MRAAGKGRVVALYVQIVRHYKLAYADCIRQLWYYSLGCGRVQVVLTHHHPADVIDNHLASLIRAYRAHVDDARLAVLFLPEAYHGRFCCKRVTRIDRLTKTPIRIAEVGHGVEGNVGHCFSKHDVKGQQAVDGCVLQAQVGGELGRGSDHETGTEECRGERYITVCHRSRRGMDDLLTQSEILEIVARPRFRVHRDLHHPVRSRKPGQARGLSSPPAAPGLR